MRAGPIPSSSSSTLANSRVRTRSWSYSNHHPPLASSPTHSVVRVGPICFGLALLFVLPLLFLSVSYDATQQTAHWNGPTTLLQRWNNPDYEVKKKQTLFELPDRRCDAHTLLLSDTNNNDGGTAREILQQVVVLEEPNQVMVLLYETARDVWHVDLQRGYAIPGSKYTTPLSRRLMAQQAPLIVAQSLIADTLGVQVPLTMDVQDTQLRYDDYHLVDGSVSNTNHNDDKNTVWTFLGRFRNLADSGGGFVFGYLVRVDDLSSSVHDTTMTTNELKEAYLSGQFSETKGTAIVGLALHHVQG